MHFFDESWSLYSPDKRTLDGAHEKRWYQRMNEVGSAEQRRSGRARQAQKVLSLNQLRRRTGSTETNGNRRNGQRLAGSQRLGGVPGGGRFKIERQDGGQGQVPTNGAIFFVSRVTWLLRRVLVRWVSRFANRVIVMQVTCSTNIAVRIAENMNVRMPPTSNHCLRNHYGAKQNRQESGAMHT